MKPGTAGRFVGGSELRHLCPTPHAPVLTCSFHPFLDHVPVSTLYNPTADHEAPIDKHPVLHAGCILSHILNESREALLLSFADRDRGDGFAPSDPSHTTGHAGPHPAVRSVEVYVASLGRPSWSKWLMGRAILISRPDPFHQLLVF